MTYEELYKPAIAEYMQKWESYFAQFKVREYKGMNIIQMREELDSRKAQLAKLEAAKPDNFDFNFNIFRQTCHFYRRTCWKIRCKGSCIHFVKWNEIVNVT